jgi:hypothetical protein
MAGGWVEVGVAGVILTAVKTAKTATRHADAPRRHRLICRCATIYESMTYDQEGTPPPDRASVDLVTGLPETRTAPTGGDPSGLSGEGVSHAGYGIISIGGSCNSFFIFSPFASPVFSNPLPGWFG